MRLWYGFPLALWVLLPLTGGGCSWQNTLYQIGQTPEYLRLDEHLRVTNPPRFRLAEGAPMSLVSDPGTPEAWQKAANAGINRGFNTPLAAAAAPAYKLHIMWPQRPENPNVLNGLSFSFGGDGALALPGMPAQQALDIKLADALGNPICTMQLHISPALWGPVWEDPLLLEQSFVHLARVMQGR